MYWQLNDNGSSSNNTQHTNHGSQQNSPGYTYPNNYGHMNAPNNQNTDPYCAAVNIGYQSNSFGGAQSSNYSTYQQWDNQLPPQNRDSSSACNSYNPVSHTPILSTAEVREPSQSLSLEASDANPTPTTENGVSSQVTPESSYSVDTFGSNGSHAEHADSSSVAGNLFPSAEVGSQSIKFRSDEDGWEHTEIETEQRPLADNLSQTQSEPVGYLSSRETSEAPSTVEHFQSEHQTENLSQHPAVAQVAPLLKQEQPIARVEPVTHANEQTNIQRVAPTRPSIPVEAFSRNASLRPSDITSNTQVFQ